MASVIQVLFFGDHSVEPYDSIIDLFREIQNSKTLAEFLLSGFEALQSETSALPLAEKSLFTYKDFAHFVEHVQVNKIQHAAISSVLSCVAQLGWTLV